MSQPGIIERLNETARDAWERCDSVAAERCEEAATTIAKLVSALKPFAAAYNDCFDEDDNDKTTIWESGASMLLTVGDLRNAAALTGEIDRG